MTFPPPLAPRRQQALHALVAEVERRQERIDELEAERDRLLAVLRDKQVIDADDEKLVRGETDDEPTR